MFLTLLGIASGLFPGPLHAHNRLSKMNRLLPNKKNAILWRKLQQHCKFF